MVSKASEGVGPGRVPAIPQEAGVIVSGAASLFTPGFSRHGASPVPDAPLSRPALPPASIGFKGLCKWRGVLGAPLTSQLLTWTTTLLGEKPDCQRCPVVLLLDTAGS